MKNGFIKTLLLILIALVILGYFGFDVKTIIESDPVQQNLTYVWGFVTHIWDDYLKAPARYLWNDIFIDLIWDTFVENMDRLKAGKPTTIEENAPESVQ